MTKRLAAIALIATTFTLTACGDDESTAPPTTLPAPSDTQRLWIQPELVDCEGVAPQTCMQISETPDGSPELFYDAIEGFTFVEGTGYVIDVTIEEIDNPPADGSSLRYTLVEIVEQVSADG